MYKKYERIKLCQRHLIQWNKHHFRHVHNRFEKIQRLHNTRINVLKEEIDELMESEEVM